MNFFFNFFCKDSDNSKKGRKDNETLTDNPESSVDNIPNEVHIPDNPKVNPTQDNPEVNPTQETTKDAGSKNVEDSLADSTKKPANSNDHHFTPLEPLVTSKIYY